MYYEVLVNGESLGVFGHPQVKNMHIAVSLADEVPEIFASAVCAEDGALYFYDWIQHRVAPDDVVAIHRTAKTSVAEPRNKYRMKNKPSTDRQA